MFNWNLIGILCWLLIAVYAVFVTKDIRYRRIGMILKGNKRFSKIDFAINLVEVTVLCVLFASFLELVFFYNPNLNNNAQIESQVTYKPLVSMVSGNNNTAYVKYSYTQSKNRLVNYRFYTDGSRFTVNNTYASIAFTKEPWSLNSLQVPYDKNELMQMDKKYQHAFVAIYTAKYKNTFRNGLGLHVGNVATNYYLIRVPDKSFIKEQEKD
ncbi:MAG: LVIS_2131 family protein [Lactobacillus sp.]|nr:LVIS_2131 family protein [Lactobacillus sp.]